MINKYQSQTILSKIRRSTYIGALSVAMMTAASMTPMAFADSVNGHIGNDPDPDMVPGNSGAALSEEGNGQTACAGQVISSLASTYQGINFANPPTTTVDFVDLLFYAGDLLPSDFDCSQLTG